MLPKSKNHLDLLLLLMLLLNFPTKCYSNTLDSSVMKGNHLIVALSSFPIAVTTERNSSGYIVNLSGVSPLMLDWLSTRFGFSYSIFQTNKILKLDSTTDTPGLIHYLIEGKCHLVMGAFAMSASRKALIDFSQGYIYTSNAFVIPMPDSSNNIAAVIKPFQLSVWLAIILTIPCVLGVFYYSRHLYQSSILQRSDNSFRKVAVDESNVQPATTSQRSSSPSFPLYIFGLLLNQGSNYPTERLYIRMILTGWCLSAFVLTTGYNSVLISYVTSPNAEPLIRSINDLTNISSVKIVVDRGLGVDLGLSLATEEGIFKQMGDKLRSYSKSRCAKTEECIDLVKSGGHVYISTFLATLSAMKNDFRSTGRCDLTLAKQREYATPWVWALAKKSPFGEHINRGILEMRDYGLVDVWTQWFQPDMRHCLDEAEKILAKRHSSSDKPPRLSLKNLTGAFAILIGGIFLSFLVFVVENLFYKIKLMKKGVSQPRTPFVDHTP